MTFLLDTNACVDYLTGRYPRVADRIQRTLPADLCVSSIVAAELRYGADNSRYPVQNHSRLDVFLAEVRCLDFDLAASTAYGAIRVALERRGQPVGAHDMLIAAHAISAGAVLVSDNVREFSRVKGLSVENWRR